MKQSDLLINIPNILSVIRILLTPIFVIFLLKDLFFFAFLAFAIAAISDSLDGVLARYLNQRTLLGAYLDPIADKLLLITVFVSLAILEIVPAWLAVIVVSRDILIMLAVAVFTITGINVKTKPSIISKCTTVAQVLTVLFSLLDLMIQSVYTVKWILYWLTAGLTITSCLHYTYMGMSLFKHASENKQTRK